MTCKEIIILYQKFKSNPSIPIFEELRESIENNPECDSDKVSQAKKLVYASEEIIDGIYNFLIQELEEPSLELVKKVDESRSFFEFLASHPTFQPVFEMLPEWVGSTHIQNAGYGADTIYLEASDKYYDIKSRAPWAQEKIAEAILDIYENPEDVLEAAKEYRIEKNYVANAAEKKSRYPYLYLAILGTWPLIIAFTNAANVVAHFYEILTSHPEVIEGIRSLIMAHQTLLSAYNTFMELFHKLGEPPLDYLVVLGPQVVEWVRIAIEHGGEVIQTFEEFVRRHTDFQYYVDYSIDELTRIANPLDVLQEPSDQKSREEFIDTLRKFAERVDEHVQELEQLGDLTIEDRQELQKRLLDGLGIRGYFSTFADYVENVTGYRMRSKI